MASPHVLITDFAWTDLDVERDILSRAGAELAVAPAHDVASLIEAVREADAIMTCWAPLPAEVIDAAPKCRVIARLGIGLDNIDVARATARRIAVTNVPDYCLEEVAEHTLALLLALARKVAFYHLATKQGRYDLRAELPIHRVAGQTLGLIGYGNIGSTVARKAQAFGLNVLATTRRESQLEGAVWRPLDDLLAESDFICLHLPLTDDSRHLIDAARLARMKSSACLINTSRGGLVDHPALARALSAGKLAGAALDVHEPEPPDLAQAPWNHPHVIVTPHVAFASEESLADLRRRATQSVVDVLSGRRPRNLVNPDVWV
ncbi:MAG: C-terminal binding protein [Pirellulales bacterium]|nr:C-terminal binding protein [Pirellulales bacterium]